MLSLQPFVATMPTLAVAAVYCVWNAYEAFRRRKARTLRERVTYMLWVMANAPELSETA
jgi:hypothetical protein